MEHDGHFGHLDGFLKRRGRAELPKPIDVGAGNDHNGDIGNRRIQPLLPAERPPVHDGHAEVEQNGRDVAGFAQAHQALGAVCRLQHRESFRAQESRDRTANRRIIVDDENGREARHGQGGRPLIARRHGRLHGDFHVRVRPAALKPAAALAG